MRVLPPGLVIWLLLKDILRFVAVVMVIVVAVGIVDVVDIQFIK